MKISVKRMHPDAIIPQFATAGAACFDLHVIKTHRALTHALHPGDAITFRTGLAFEVPPGHVMMIFSRSGHGFKNDVRLSNCVGIIDADYRGEVMVKLRNDKHIGFGSIAGDKLCELTAMEVRPGDRIAQAMILPLPMVELVEVDDLSKTDRGTGGFGSTGT